jgi:hypothetical protein
MNHQNQTQGAEPLLTAPPQVCLCEMVFGAPNFVYALFPNVLSFSLASCSVLLLKRNGGSNAVMAGRRTEELQELNIKWVWDRMTSREGKI